MERETTEYAGNEDGVSLQGTVRDVPSRQERFLQRLRDQLEQLMRRHRYTVIDLASEMCLGRRQLYRRVRATTGEAPGELMRRYRLERVASLLAADAGSAVAIARQTGFSSAGRLSRCFREAYGMTPRRYREQYRGRRHTQTAMDSSA